MCIYYGNEEALTYRKQEHVFPAGLGGIAMLPRGLVSDQANEFFSPMEAVLMRDSLLGVERAILGPGKRGSHNPKKASISKISVVESTDGKLVLGYFSNTNGYYINSLCRNKDKFTFAVASDQHDAPELAWESFRDAARSFPAKFVRIEAKELDQGDWIFGSHKGKYYLAMGPQCELEAIKKELSHALDHGKSGELHRKNDQPTFHILSVESEITNRVYAKVAINTLAMLRGEKYICHERFAPVKSWILGRSDFPGAAQLPRLSPENDLPLPQDCHWCFFFIGNGKLCAIVTFYNTYYRCFELADCIASEDYGSSGTPFGMICDWRNKREFTFDDWILEYIKQIGGYPF